MKTNTKPHRVKVGELTYADLARDEETPVVLYGLGDFYELSDKDYFTNTYGRFEKGKTLPTNQRYNLVAALADCGVTQRTFKQFISDKSTEELFQFLQHIDSFGFKSSVLYTLALKGSLPSIESLLAETIYQVLFVGSSMDDNRDELYSIRDEALGCVDTRVDSVKALTCAEKMVEHAISQLDIKEKPSADSVLKRVFDPDRVILLDNNKYAMAKKIYDVEQWVGKACREELEPLQLDFTPTRACRLGDDQKRAVCGVSTGNRVVVLQGMPGTGKSTVIEALYAMQPEDSVLITAYTKKACSVLTARIMDYSLGEDKGVRSLMSCYFKSLNNKKFCEALRNVRMLVVDESSMLSSGLLWYTKSILNKCASDCRLVLVGDVNQLPPVKSYGRPLKTLVAAKEILGTQVFVLDTFRRSSSVEIFKSFCKMMKAGTHQIDASTDGCVKLYKANSVDNAVRAVARMLVDSEQSNKNTFAVAETNALCNSINLETSRALYGDKLHFRRIKEGDEIAARHIIPDLVGMRVVAVRDVCSRRGERKFCNNEMGRVTEVTEDTVSVFHEIYRREIVLTRQELEESFQVAYCATVFKFQGSEDSEVIYAFDSDMNFSSGLNKWSLFSQMREQKYVALSRPRDRLHIVAVSRKGSNAFNEVDSLSIKVVDSETAKMYLC